MILECKSGDVKKSRPNQKIKAAVTPSVAFESFAAYGSSPVTAIVRECKIIDFLLKPCSSE